ncbi:MAG: hypothetical protein LBJ98_03415 [Endomicrobium sp.]|jgi:hypothetical protein|nr:hypothetical protein [Endomicrobium sp.]
MIDNIWTPLGVFASIAGVVITVLLLVVRFIFLIGKWKERQDYQEKETAKLGNKIEQVRVELGEIKVNAKETATKVDLIYKSLIINPLMQKNSPVTLSEKGEIERKEIKADEIFEKYKNKLINKIDKEKEKNAYDIEIEAFRVIDVVLPKLLNETELNAIKNEAFKLGLPFSDFLIIFKILLRDFLLNKKGIGLKAIYKDETNKQQVNPLK